MFTYLKVKNFALIEDIEIDFRPGFTAFVGETGAGKSLLVDAINILSGARSSVSFVKSGADHADIQGTFFLPENHIVRKILSDEMIEVEPGEDILISRRISSDGRTVCRIQGTVVPVALVRRFMSKLVDIHGQHENNYLLEEKNHLFLLDVFTNNQTVLHAYQKEFDVYFDLHEKQKEFKVLEEELQLLDEHKQKLEKLQNANILEGELEELQAQFTQMKDFSHNYDLYQKGQQLFENTSLLGDLYTLQDDFKRSTSSSGKELATRIASLYYELEDVSHSISEASSALVEERESLAQVEKRIETIFSLQREFGDDLVEAREALETKINRLENLEYEVIQNTRALESQQAIVLAHAQKLTTQRQASAQQLSQQIMDELQDLYLTNVTFSVEISQAKLSRNGSDQAIFYIKTNVGEEAQPLAKIASGGELSRIMLAIKIVFASRQTLSTIIFDEIDTGVSGKVSEAIAKKMRIFSESQQVFSITHLPQVLSASTQQLYIWKYIEDEKTHVNAKYLSPEEHTLEVAKMLSGENVNDAALVHAQTLIESFKG